MNNKTHRKMKNPKDADIVLREAGITDLYVRATYTLDGKVLDGRHAAREYTEKTGFPAIHVSGKGRASYTPNFNSENGDKLTFPM